VLLLGPPGVGKTHLAVALAVKACQAGQTIFFTTMADLIEKLKADHEAKKTGRGTATACAASLPRKRRQRLSGYPKALLGP
jgi:DNA replication protein DnaC